jgi:lysozyme
VQTSINGIDLIKEFEGFSSKPYICPAGVPTIGYGSTYYEDNDPVTMNDDPITEYEALRLLKITLFKYEKGVSNCVSVPLSQNRFDALVSFVYNLGVGKLRGSTLLTKLNKGDIKGAADEFDKWVHGGGEVLPGLVKRRAAEKALFLS